MYSADDHNGAICLTRHNAKLNLLSNMKEINEARTSIAIRHPALFPDYTSRLYKVMTPGFRQNQVPVSIEGREKRLTAAVL